MDRDEVIRRGHAEGRTLREVGDELGITRERVRQLAQDLGLRFQTPTRRALAGIETARALVDSGVSVYRAARVAGVADLTLRQAGLRSSPRPIIHNRYRYTRGCRCEICMAANRESARSLRGKEPPTHGTQSAYCNYGCPCELCKAAGAAANRAQADKRRGPLTHGLSGFRRGCRCEVCAEAMRTLNEKMRAAKRAKETKTT